MLVHFLSQILSQFKFHLSFYLSPWQYAVIMNEQIASLRKNIESIYSQQTQPSQNPNPSPITEEEQQKIQDVIALLDCGQLRVCEKINSEWKTQEWVKKAILLYFKIQKISLLEAGDFNFLDKIPIKN